MTGRALLSSTGLEQTAPASAGSLSRMLHVLALFDEAQPYWSAASLIEALGTSRATGYRYIKTLYDAGLLTVVGNGYYSLGPRIIEMDLQIRLADPLLLASQGVLEELVEKIGHSALLLTAFHDVSVVCIGECRAPTSPANRFSRGQRRPLFQGAGSKVILAHLPHHRLKAIYARHAKDIGNAGLGTTWADFRKILGQIKRDGYHLTRGDFNPGVYGVAAPILSFQKTALGSIGVAWDEKERSDVDVQGAVAAVRQAAQTVSQRLIQDPLPFSGRALPDHGG
ncbi:IclR family transcriptional regulator [Arthrobacter sp. NPDC057009]|uniref:IclR family transcriptional regulator n=1 Tax=Arthrobacter sp. NPDC057009 TaxID=3345996 RepID=UPI00363AC87F